MAFPQVDAVNGGNNTEDSTEHTVNLPANISAGNLLLVFFASDEVPTITFPEGWTQLFQEVNATCIKFGAWYRIADGEEGATITVTTSASEQSAHTSYRITGYSGTPEAGTATTGYTVNPNPPNLTPSWGAADTLWFASCSNDFLPIVTVYPTDYTDGRYDNSYTINGCLVGTARRELNAVSEDPGTFTLSFQELWVANTVAIKPVGPVTHEGAATLSGVGTLAGISVVTFIGKSTLAGVGTLASIGVITAIGKVTLAGVGTLATLWTRVRFGTATLAGVGTLASLGYITAIGKATLSGVGTLASSGVITAIGKALLAGVGTLAAIGRAKIEGLSDYMEDAIINFMRAVAFPSPAPVYVALFTSESGVQANNPTSEVSGGSYARQAVTLNASSDGATENSADVEFPKATDGWGSIVCAAFVDHETNTNWGVNVNVLMSLTLVDNHTIESGDRFLIPAGDLDVSVV